MKGLGGHPETNTFLTRLAQRSLALQPGNSLISLALTLSVGFSMSIALHAATQARRLLALTAAGLLSLTESHPIDHDSNSSGHTIITVSPHAKLRVRERPHTTLTANCPTCQHRVFRCRQVAMTVTPGSQRNSPLSHFGRSGFTALTVIKTS